MHAESLQAFASARNRRARDAAAGRHRRRRQRQRVVVILIAAAAVLWLVLARLHRESVESPSVRGVHLGMSPETTRAAFLDGAAGNWSAPPGCYAPTLEWTRADANASSTRWARFAFHQGRLVAIRLLAEPDRRRRLACTLRRTRWPRRAREPMGPPAPRCLLEAARRTRPRCGCSWHGSRAYNPANGRRVECRGAGTTPCTGTP
jgi:hypothetical protein